MSKKGHHFFSTQVFCVPGPAHNSIFKVAPSAPVGGPGFPNCDQPLA